MAEKKIKWTKQQRRAIEQRGSDVLVTASAGTGKTAVLSGRCVNILSDESICGDVLNMLVLTFTEAAAEQMHSRIAEQLKEAFLESGNRRFRHQLILLQGADISTIHSFCKRLITEYFYKLGIDPTFRVIDDDERRLLKREVLERTIEWAWRQGNLAEGMAQLFGRRDLRTSDGFAAKIISMSDFLDGVVSRQSWYERTLALSEALNPFAGELGKKQKQIVAEELQSVLEQLRSVQQFCQKANADETWCQWLEEKVVEVVLRCIEYLKSENWQSCAEEIRNFRRPRFNKPKSPDEPVAGMIRDTAKKAAVDFERLKGLAIINPDYLDRISGAVSGQTRIMVELVKKFDRLYSRAKQTINCLDFADLEHYALKLLTKEGDKEDQLLPSETALALRRKYKYIFVDEYQDINPVQKEILAALSCEDNVFVVGDVKQSIYAFRGAEPRIFTEELKSATVEPKGSDEGLRVDLTANFRSNKSVLDFVNKLFGRIMTSSFADIDYDESARLRPAVMERLKEASGSERRTSVELHILDDEIEDTERRDESGEDENSGHERGSITISDGLRVVSSRQRQAAIIAGRIREMVGADGGEAEFEIFDKQQGKMRDVEYRDIVILMRSPAKRVNDYIEVLRLAGIPVSCEASSGYFEATEIRDLLSLLKVLDNPQRDIELAAVLRSPLFNISDSELAKIKIHRAEKTEGSEDLKSEEKKRKNFHDSVCDYCESGSDVKLAERLKEVLALLEQWRTVGRRGDIAELIWQIYRETGYLFFVPALANGQVRRANLFRLHERAIQFEGFASSVGVPSLTRFVEFIEKLYESGLDWSTAEEEASAGNAVRIMSIHKSKGLEFPVVFLAELNSQFSSKDLQDDCIAEAGGGLGLRIIESRTKTKVDSAAYQIIEKIKRKTALAEEMRILYVATTRARERLVLTASEKAKRCREVICDGILFGSETAADWQLGRCRSHLEWVLYGLSDKKVVHDGFGSGLAPEAGDDNLFDFKLYEKSELERLSRYVFELRRRKRIQFDSAQSKLGQGGSKDNLLPKVKERLAWRYGFGDVCKVPAKRSVTQLTHLGDEYVKVDYSGVLARKPKAVSAVDAAESVQSRLIGTATHLVISRLDLTKQVNKEVIDKTVGKLVAAGAIAEAVAEHIDTGSIMTFFESKLGRLALDANNTVWCEWPFTFALSACEFADLGNGLRATSDEAIVVQGIVDVLVKTPEGLLIIDFKTDSVTAEQAEERAELYREQLGLYGRAAGAILNDKLHGKWVYFLSCAISVELE